MRWPQPSNEDDFEEFCLELLQEHWQRPSLERYGHRGDRQNGVDLWDPHGIEPRRAAQCKHHASSKTLPPRELEEEVAKAKGFAHKISEFFLLTTGKRSVATADRLGCINDAHRQQGHFLVTIWYWDDLERIVSRSPRLQQLLAAAPISVVTDMVERTARQIVEASTLEQTGDEIDRVRRAVQRGRLAEARELIQALQAKEDRLSDLQRARLLTQRAMVAEEEGKPAEAARLLLQAVDLAPNEESCIGNAVFALSVLKNVEGARDAAGRYALRFPNSAAAWAAFIQTASEDDGLESVRTRVPEWALQTSEVLIALAELARSRKHSETVGAIRAAVAAGTPTTQARARLAHLWLDACVDEAREAHATPVDELSALRDFLGESIREAERQEHLVLAAECHRLRGIVHDYLGNEAEANADLSASVETYPSSRARLTYAQHLLGRGANDDAILQLDRNDFHADTTATELLRAIARWQRARDSDREDSARDFVRLAEALDGTNELEALTHAVHALIVLGRAKEAAALVDKKAQKFPAALPVLLSRVALALGDKETALIHARRAAEDPSVLPPILGRWLALGLGTLDLPKVALLVWETVVPMDSLSEDTYRLMQLAGDLGRDDVILKRGAALRAAGVFDSHLLHQELAVAERYDLEKAFAVASEACDHCQQDKLLRLRRSWLASRTGRNDFVAVAEPDLPEPADARGDAGRVIVRLLLEKGEHKRALIYAYEIYRHSPRDPDALRCMKDVFFQGRSALEVADPNEINVESAVRVEERGGTSRWFFIETADDADITRGEVGPDSTLGRELLGRRVGETVTLSHGMGIERTAVVAEVTSKYARRMQQVFDSFEIVVPDKPELSVMHMGDGKGGIDLAPLLDLLRAGHERAEQAVAAYEQKPILSMHSLGHMLGRNQFEALCELLRRGKPVRCARCTRDEQQDAMAASLANEVVLDLSAALTLFAFEGDALISAFPTRLVTSQGTIDTLRATLERLSPEGDGPRMGASFVDGRLVFVEETADVVKARRERVAAFLELFERRISVVPASDLPIWATDRRELLTDFFGWHACEVLALAAVPGRTLWCDDFSLSEIAKQEFSCARTWTQSVGLRLETEGLLKPGVYETLSAHLLGAGYEFTSVNRAVLNRCGELSTWQIGRPPLAQAIAYVTKPELDDPVAAELGLELLAMLLPQMALPLSRENCQAALQEALLRRVNPRAALRAYARALPRIFRLNPIGLSDAKRSFASWLRARGITLQ